MATKTTVTLVDDLDDGPASETVSFSLDGANYEIDLNDDNAKKMRDSLELYVSSARRARGVSSRRSERASAPASARRGSTSRGSRISELGYTVDQVRAWAKTQPDVEVGDKGRVPNSVIEAYHTFQQNGGKVSANGSAPARKTAAKKAARKTTAAATS